MTDVRILTVPRVRDTRYDVHRQWVRTLDGDYVFVTNYPEPTTAERCRVRTETTVAIVLSAFLWFLTLGVPLLMLFG